MDILGGTLTYRLRGQLAVAALTTDALQQHAGLDVNVREETAFGGRRFVMTLVPAEPLEIVELVLSVRCPVGRDERAFLNGFQSWTESREFHPHEAIVPMRRLVREPLKPFSDYHFYNYTGRSGVLHGYTYSYVRRRDGRIHLCGSLSEAGGYTQLEYVTGTSSLFVRKDVADLVIDEPLPAFDLLFLDGDEAQILPRYFDALGIKMTETRHRSGWTSWYHYYTKVTEKDVLENLEHFAKRRLPIDLFQIDDGYQQAIGDWLIPNKKFPSGMARLAKHIRDAGYGAGLWIAPFICDRRSDLYKRHPDWIARDGAGRMVKAGFNPEWKGDFFALDFDNPDVKAYVKEVFDTILGEWGYSLLKLDFLYAAALLHKKNRPRALIMREAMQFMRTAAGDKLLLGCGVPLAPSFGLVDYCRIGSDVARKWEDKFLRFIAYRERASTVNSLMSTIGRRHMNEKVFLSDPDVFLLRTDNNAMTFEQKHTLFTLNAVFGALLFTSDNISKYTPIEMAQYESLFPLKKKLVDDVTHKGDLVSVRFRIDGRRYLSLSNLGPKPVMGRLPPGWLFSSKLGIEAGNRDQMVRPFETYVFHLIDDDTVGLAGSEGHLFPGSELSRLDVDDVDGSVTLEIDPRTVKRSALWIFVRDDRQVLVVNGEPHSVTSGAGARQGARWVCVELASLPAPPATVASTSTSPTVSLSPALVIAELEEQPSAE